MSVLLRHEQIVKRLACIATRIGYLTGAKK